MEISRSWECIIGCTSVQHVRTVRWKLCRWIDAVRLDSVVSRYKAKNPMQPAARLCPCLGSRTSPLHIQANPDMRRSQQVKRQRACSCDTTNVLTNLFLVHEGLARTAFCTFFTGSLRHEMARIFTPRGPDELWPRENPRSMALFL